MKSLSKPKVVVMTGTSAGVGHATARVFAWRKAHVGLLTRGRDGLEVVATSKLRNWGHG